MSGDELAGTLRQRVTIARRDGVRDALGGAGGDWAPVATLWAAIAPAGSGEAVAGDALSAMPRWLVVLRAGADVRVGDRLLWGGRRLAVRARRDDPALPDRITLSTGEER